MKGKNKKEYKTGREDLDRIIVDLAKACDANDNIDLIEEMLTTVVKLSIENDDRGDLKLINMAFSGTEFHNKNRHLYLQKQNSESN